MPPEIAEARASHVTTPPMPSRRFRRLTLAVVLMAAAFRLPRLELRPMHGDEAIHAYKCNELWTTGRYVYDPHDYHGPTLNYFTLPVMRLSGARDWRDAGAATFRIVPAIFGIAAVAIIAPLADGLGRPAALGAMLLAAISPALAFYSRYYIQEMLLAFFTLAAIACGWRYVRSRRVGWALLCGVCVGLMHATKETCVIALGVMMAAGTGAWVWRSWGRTAACVRGNSPGRHSVERSDEGTTRERQDALHPRQDSSLAARARNDVRGAWSPLMHCCAALLTAIAVSVSFYSSFFTNPCGPLDSLRAYGLYLHRAGGAGLHDHPWDYYLRMLLYTHSAPGPAWSEALIVVLAVLGLSAVAAGKPLHLAGATSAPASTTGGRGYGQSGAVAQPGAAVPHALGEAAADPRLLHFLAVYAVLMTAVYSAIPYKTPWSMVQFLVPLTLLAGLGAVALLRWLKRPILQAPAGALLIAAAAQLGVQSYRTSLDARFVNDYRNPYVYAHPHRGLERLAAYLEKLAAVHPDGRRMLVRVITPDCWPLPWYLRRLEAVGYWEGVADDDRLIAGPTPVVITTLDLHRAVESRLRGDYHVSYYGLRPDVPLLVYVERGLYNAFVRTQSGPVGGPPAPSRPASAPPAQPP